jgi:hypothetical protein
MFRYLILLLWSQILDAKLLRNKFQKQLIDVVLDLTHSLDFQIVNSNI